MRMEIIEKTYYKFDELSDEAKEKALNKFREWAANDPAWQEENRETLNAFESVFPVKILNWEYGDRNFINFRMQAEDEIRELSGWRLAAYLWNNYGRKLFKGKYYTKPFRIDENGKPHHKFRHSKIILEHDCALTGFYMDNEIFNEIYKYMSKLDNRDFEQLLSDCLYNWVHACRKDLEWQCSDKVIMEDIKNNDYEFDENGKLI
ncbi:MAG: hypothetical protein WC417_06355 [Candidatus Omnitrophota bacterium]|jgi:hypothetical protein